MRGLGPGRAGGAIEKIFINYNKRKSIIPVKKRGGG
jgi:hypothetical protein